MPKVVPQLQRAQVALVKVPASVPTQIIKLLHPGHLNPRPI